MEFQIWMVLFLLILLLFALLQVRSFQWMYLIILYFWTLYQIPQYIMKQSCLDFRKLQTYFDTWTWMTWRIIYRNLWYNKLISHPLHCLKISSYSLTVVSCDIQELSDSFVFPPYGGNAVSRTIAPLESISPVAQTTGIIPTVPPRKKVEQLPSPLFGDAVHVVWNKLELISQIFVNQITNLWKWKCISLLLWSY